MDIYSVILEAKDTKKIVDEDTLTRIYNPAIEGALFSIAANNENDNYVKLASEILKNKDNYYKAKRSEKLDDFIDDLNSSFKKILKKNKHKKFDEFIEYAEEISHNISNNIKTAITNPDAFIFKLFLNEYNTKYAFTWERFKEVKRQFEKNHPLEGENIYNLKSLLEKDPGFREKINNQTLFCKASHTLSQKTIDAINEKIS